MTVLPRSPLRRDLPREHYLKPLLETPFDVRIADLMTTDSWAGWAGYRSPGVIEDQELEYTAIRNSCAVFDMSPMIKYRIEGPGAEAYLTRLTLRDVGKLQVGRVQYTAWCDDEGKVLDDGTLFRWSETEFRLCAQERHLPWLLDSSTGFDVSISEETEEFAALAVQGPTSYSVLKAAGFKGVEELKPFRIMEGTLGRSKAKAVISRTGFTGDLGYEIFVDAGDALKLWDLLWKAGALYGIRAIGAAALDMARVEAGFIATNADFIASEQAVRNNRRRSPFEIGLDWMVDFDKGHFNGRRALLAEKQDHTSRYCLVGLEIDGNEPAHHALVYHRKKREAGVITAGLWSPTCKRNIAIATLERPFGATVNDDLWVEIYVMHELQYHKLMVRARVVDRPFLRLPRRTATPPGLF